MKDPLLRACELRTTGAAQDYIVEYDALVVNPEAIERTVHLKLAKFRQKGEWFRCTPDDAVVEIQRVSSGSIIFEKYHIVVAETINARRQQEQLAAAREQLYVEKLRDIERLHDIEMENQLPDRTLWLYIIGSIFPVAFVLILATSFADVEPGSFLLPIVVIISIVGGIGAKSFHRKHQLNSPLCRRLQAKRNREITQAREMRASLPKQYVYCSHCSRKLSVPILHSVKVYCPFCHNSFVHHRPTRG